MSKHLVEESWILSVSDLKKDLRKIRNNEENVQGEITLRNESKTMQATYWGDYRDDEAYLSVVLPGTVPMEISLETMSIRYGSVTFLKCPGCSKRCTKLYVHPEIGKGWKCVRCHKLIYHLQSFSPYSRLGIAEYKMDQLDKLCVKKKPRFFYAGKVTKPLKRHMHRMQKMGLLRQVSDFNLQIAEYKSLSQKISIFQEFLGKDGNLAVRR